MSEWDSAAAEAHLAAADPVMAGLITLHGRIPPDDPAADPFHALARSIVFQQLSGKAASTIFGRFVALFPLEPGRAFPGPAAILAAEDERLRGAGLSRQKAAAVRSLAEHFASGELSSAVFATLNDDELIERTTRVRGVGRWTAEMFLMFHLARPNVLPLDDAGLIKGISVNYFSGEPVSRAEAREVGDAWAPFRSVATWYLWRSLDPLPVDY